MRHNLNQKASAKPGAVQLRQLGDADHADAHQVRLLVFSLGPLRFEGDIFKIEVKLVDIDSHQQPKTIGRHFSRKNPLLLSQAFVELT